MIFFRGMIIRLILGLLILISGLPAYAQMEILSTEDGLSQGKIFDILQDREGFIWIGTKDGLNRYDGNEFEIFTNDPNDPWSISGNTIVTLFEDTAGRIWAVAENAGINIYDKTTGRFHHIYHDLQNPASLSGNYVTSIVEDTTGYFVVGVGSEEINLFRLEEEFFNEQKQPGVIKMVMPLKNKIADHPNMNSRRIAKDALGRIWVGGEDAIFRLDVSRASLKLAVEGYTFDWYHTNPDGSIWATAQTPFHWDGEQIYDIVHEKLDGFRGLQVDDGRMWLVSPISLDYIDLKGWIPGVKTDQPLELTRVFSEKEFQGQLTCLLVDRSGIVWIGTNGYGIYKYNPKVASFAHKLPGQSVRNFLKVGNNYFIILYSGSILNREGKIVTPPYFKDEESQENKSFPWRNLYVDKLMFLKSGQLLQRFNPHEAMESFIVLSDLQNWEHSVFFSIQVHDQIQPMIQSRDGIIWMAGWDHVLSSLDLKNGELISYNLNDGQFMSEADIKKAFVSQVSSTTLYEDTNGILWIGSIQGFTKCERSKVNGGTLKTSNYENIPGDNSSLSYNHVTCFLDDPRHPDRYLWIATKGGGINRMDKVSGKMIRLSKMEGLPDNVVYGILADNDGNIWGSTNKGIFRMTQEGISGDENKDAFSFLNFSRADGLQAEEFNTGAFAKLPDGRLLFGGVNGYNIFDPAEIVEDSYPAPTFITGISINNKKILPGDESGVLEKTIETTEEISLNHFQDILTLDFVTLDYKAPDRIKYRYKLIGASDEWVEVSNNRSATFLHLSPKDYVFQVQGSNSQGIWGDQVAELRIRILPPWWRTWWAYLIYTAIFVSAILLYFRFSIKRAKLRQELAFEKKESDRVRELDALKTQLYMNMTHEFRTPLTIILGMAKQIKENPKDYFSSGLKMITRNGEQLLKLVNRMLDLSKLENGKMSLQLVQDDLVIFLRNIVESFRSYAANKEIQLHFLPEIDSLMMDFDRDKMQQVVSNLISNAFKFTPQGGHIYFGLRKTDSTISIRVKDTGRGIPPADMDKVFDRFYQVDNGTTRQYGGSGIGLALSSELVLLMKGRISVQSPPTGAQKGAEFIVELPISREAIIQESPQIVTQATEESVPEPVEPIKEAPKEIQPPVTPTNENPLILLVEDNADVVAYVASCLQDYRLAVAENGQEGYDIAIDIIPDLIISDVMMPVMDGFEFCHKVKSDERTDHIPVIMLTARADMESKIEGMELGANAYLPKPYEKQELLLNIKNLFQLRDNIRKRHQNLVGIGNLAESEQDQSRTKEVEDPFVARVRELVETHLTDFDLNVDQLSRELYLSPSQLRRKLDALTGFSPNRFIRNLRLKKAKKLLLNKDLSITAIAFDSGFSDPSYFTRVFKKELGASPMEWRIQNLD